MLGGAILLAKGNGRGAEARSRGCNCSVVRDESGKPGAGRDDGTRYVIEESCAVHG